MCKTGVSASSIVTIPYQDLLSNRHDPKVLSDIGKGFGDEGLGIIAITDVPNLSELRSKLLHLSYKLATSLSKEDLDRLTLPESGYSVGWSHGKEKLEGDKFDTSKGSFYVNPMTDDIVADVLDRDSLLDSTNVDIEKKKDHFLKIAKDNPAFYHPNVWPDEELPELKDTVREMGKLIRDIGIHIARQCDKYVLSKCSTYPEGKLENIIQSSLCPKGRLLHYFPSDINDDSNDANGEEGSKTNDIESTSRILDNKDFSTWCGWHNDHSTLTGLVPAIYINKEGEEISCPDPSSGLYIKSRQGGLIHAKIPKGALAFQIGETTQIHTGGILQATPHAVRGCDPKKEACKGVSREVFAVFMQPEFFHDTDIPEGRTIEDAQKLEAEKHLPRTVKPLRSRWSPGINFGEFSNNTFAAFY